MRKVLFLVAISILALSSIGCSGGADTASEPPPKGAMPETVNAPPGSKNPEERGREEAKNAEPQDGGGGGGGGGAVGGK